MQHDTAQAAYDRPGSVHAARLLGEVSTLPGRIEELFDDGVAIRLACGPSVEAVPAAGLRPGDPCVLVLRPERIALAAIPAGEMGQGALQATVIEARCLGESWRVSVLIGSGASVVLRRPAAAGLRGVAPGLASRSPGSRTTRWRCRPSHDALLPLRPASLAGGTGMEDSCAPSCHVTDPRPIGCAHPSSPSPSSLPRPSKRRRPARPSRPGPLRHRRRRSLAVRTGWAWRRRRVRCAPPCACAALRAGDRHQPG